MHHPREIVDSDVHVAVELRVRLVPRDPSQNLENMVNKGESPPSVKIGKKVYWSEVAVRKWQLLFAAREAWRPVRKPTRAA